IKNAVSEIRAKRLVVDSITTYATFIEIGAGKIGDYSNVEILDRIIPTPITSEIVTRMKVHNIMRDIKELNCTTIITSELPRESIWYSRDTISEFLADGIVLMDHLPVIGKRTIKVIKLRWKAYEEGARTLDITSKGIEIGGTKKRGKLF
ncbi:MAG: hypothetical protein GOV15_02125, partial [Candidatus Diapherotrites archaeon]|nr:hypothetical protein [Candidatus Diapherotrites archaeon]